MSFDLATPRRRIAGRFVAFTLGLLAFGTPLDSLAQAQPAPPPPPPGVQQLPPPPPPQAGQQPYPPPAGQPGQPAYPYPYPYPYAQPGQPPYPPPYGYPPGAYPQQQRELPNVIAYKEGDPIPPGYKPEMRVRKGLVISGAVIFGVFYFFTAVGAAGSLDSNRAPMGALFVPVIGPFIVAATGNFGGSGGTVNFSGLTNIMFAIDGIVQAGGGAMLLAGIFAKKKVLARQDVEAAERPEFFVGPGSVGMKLRF